ELPAGVYPARYFDDEADRYVPFKESERPRRLTDYTSEEVAALTAITPEERKAFGNAYVNRTQAPVNPLPYIVSVWEANLEGDIAFANVDYQWLYFNEDGDRIYPRKDFFTNEEAARQNKGVYLLFDEG